MIPMLSASRQPLRCPDTVTTPENLRRAPEPPPQKPSSKVTSTSKYIQEVYKVPDLDRIHLIPFPTIQKYHFALSVFPLLIFHPSVVFVDSFKRPRFRFCHHLLFHLGPCLPVFGKAICVCECVCVCRTVARIGVFSVIHVVDEAFGRCILPGT